MPGTAHVAIIGEYDADSAPHRATNAALEHAAATRQVRFEAEWLSTEGLDTSEGQARLRNRSGIWIAPGSPYKSMAGALAAIRLARDEQVPLLATCGGFQHVILEYARNVLGFEDAQHAEYDPYASRLVVSKLTCSLVGRALAISLRPESRVAGCYGRTSVEEQYYCNFGVNPEYVALFENGPLRTVGSDLEGAVRVVELTGHPFFVGTLYLPQLRSTVEHPHPLVVSFISAVSAT